jgi:hypothetical protein
MYSCELGLIWLAVDSPKYIIHLIVDKNEEVVSLISASVDN